MSARPTFDRARSVSIGLVLAGMTVTLLAFAGSRFDDRAGRVGAAESPEKAAVDDERIEPFELPDLDGAPWRLAERPERPIAVIFIGAECPIVGLAIDRIGELAREHQGRVDFVLIDSNRQDSADDLKRFAHDHQVTLPLLRDVGNRIADAMRAERTPEAILIDRDRLVRYRGRIDDRYSYGVRRPEATSEELANAIEELLAGRPIAVPRTEAVGCLIGRLVEPAADASVTYCNRVAAILQKKCLECHRSGEIGPFSMESYDEIVGWAEMIAETVETERMPPWHADPNHGDFANDRRLTDDEKRAIYDWTEAGAPYGDPADLPEPPSFIEGWRIGEPDLVIPMSDTPFSVPAKGEVPYQYFVVDPGFKTDRWIRQAECRPGNREVVHHIIIGIQTPEGRERQRGELESEWLTATAPGAAPLDLPAGMAKRIPAGSKLVFQMHYTTNGRATTDLSQVGFVFVDEAEVRHEMLTQQVINTEFTIPPHAADHPVDAAYRFRRDSIVTALFPHMHLRGKAFRYEAEYPDGTREILLDIPRYDFNWQNAYVFREPKRFPAGTRLKCFAKFDNSSENLSNPAPDQPVRWGEQTWEEMMIGYFDMYVPEDERSR